jgi:hypothetical protein
MEGGYMKRFFVIFGCAVLIAVGLAAWKVAESAQPSSEAPLLTGQVWQQMSPDAKVAFVWGIGNLAEIERARDGGMPTQGESFIPYLVRGLSGKPINEVVREVDAYYSAHPDQLKRPVVDAVFQAMVIPKLRAEKEGGTAR